MFLVAMTLALVLLAPGGFYLYGLSLLPTKPIPAEPSAYPQGERNEAWVRCGESLPMEVEPINPWMLGYRALTRAAAPAQLPPGRRAMDHVARGYERSFPEFESRTDEVLASVAMAVWLTRNWSPEEFAATLHRDRLCIDGG